MLDCEKVKVEGNFLGTLKVTSQYILFYSDGQSTKTIYKAAAPEFTRILRESLHIYSFSEIEEIIPRRYLHQFTAVEINFYSGKSWFLNFFTTEFFHSFHKFMLKIKKFPKYPEYVHGRVDELTRAWTEERVSNFKYLMQLNKLSGRSFHDLSQYPVFPWLLSCYTSDKFEYTDPTIYRDLHYPVGAQTAEMREQLDSKYSMCAEAQMKAFHHGSHYSSGGVALHYLLRIEPFLTQSIKLQGGQMDKAERLFASMQAAWDSTQSQLGDVKELIPEVFYLVELFENRTGSSLGQTQAGTHINEVEMARWAMNSFDFIMKHQRTLEYRLVTVNLRNWVSLVFGAKQTGDTAVQFYNVFTNLSYQKEYQKSVDEALKNHCELDGLIAQIYNFGQTPVQLFTKELQGLPRMELDKQFCIPFNENTVEQTEIVCKGIRTNFLIATKELYTVSMDLDLLYISKHELTKRRGFKSNILQNVRTHLSLWTTTHPKKALAAIFSNEFVVTGGYADYSFKIHTVYGKLKNSVQYHTGEVTAIAAPGDFIFTGGRDTLLVRWIYDTTAFYCATEYYGHSSEIAQIAPLESFCWVASVSDLGTVLVHEMRTGECLRVLEFTRVKELLSSEYGFFVVVEGRLMTVFNANGTHTTFAPELGNSEISAVQSIYECEYLLVETRQCLEVFRLFQEESCLKYPRISKLHACWINIDKLHYIVLDSSSSLDRLSKSAGSIALQP